MSEHKDNVVRENTLLNEAELAARRIALASYPRALFVQLDAPCNQDCLFCSRPENYSNFDLDIFRERFGEVLEPALSRAERLNLTGSGELLFLPEAKKVLSFFNGYSAAEKMFATNGSSLTPKMVDFIVESGNRYLVHVSLHGSTRPYHAVMTGANTYDAVMFNLAHIRKIKKDAPNLRLNFVFLLTTRNLRDLPSFIRFSEESGADGVVVYYNYIYRLDQKDLSAWFAQEETNRVIDEAAAIAAEIGKKRGGSFTVSLPRKFRTPAGSPPEICTEAWTQLMVNPSGDIITCDVAGDSRENLSGKSFMNVWNGEYYKSIRKRLLSDPAACSSRCFRANPAAVDEFLSHVIVRGKSAEELAKFAEGT